MIAYADKTKIALVRETTWGQTPDSSFDNLHINAESLTPQIRSLQPQQLSHSQPPVRVEEMVSGDLEFPLAMTTLSALLPYVMLGEVNSQEINLPGANTFNASGNLLISPTPEPMLDAQDYLWLDAEGDERTGFFPLVISANQPFLKGGDNTAAITNPTLTLHRLTSGNTEASASIIRQYGPNGGWYALAGMMIQRLVIDLEEDRPPVVTASMIGRNMQTISLAPTLNDGGATETLDSGQHLKKLTFSDPHTSNDVDTGEAVITGIRIILERVGMTPQFGLGSPHPRVILPGQLSVAGSVSMLVSGNQFFNWLEDGNSLKLTLMMQSPATGFVMELPQLEISGVDGGARISDQPVRSVFHFTGSASNGQSPVRFFIKT